MMKKILIVEDDRDVAALLAYQLKAKNYEVLVAFDALQAFQIMQKESPDLLLLDINIPAGTGFSLAEKVRDFPKFFGLPFIFITSSKDPIMRERAMELNAKAYIEKPYGLPTLLKAIEDALNPQF